MIKIKGMRELSGNMSELLRKWRDWGGCRGFAINEGEPNSARTWIGRGKPTNKGRAKDGSKEGDGKKKALIPQLFDAEGAGAIVNDRWTMGDEDDCVLT